MSQSGMFGQLGEGHCSKITHSTFVFPFIVTVHVFPKTGGLGRLEFTKITWIANALMPGLHVFYQIYLSIGSIITLVTYKVLDPAFVYGFLVLFQRKRNRGRVGAEVTGIFNLIVDGSHVLSEFGRSAKCLFTLITGVTDELMLGLNMPEAKIYI